jgi:hypothetical protein
MPTINLTVQSTGQHKFRLGVNYEDSKQYFKKRGRSVTVNLGIKIADVVNTKTTCGPPLMKGFDLYSSEIDKWIKNHSFHLYPWREPTKLQFKFSVPNGLIKLDFIKKL